MTEPASIYMEGEYATSLPLLNIPHYCAAENNCQEKVLQRKQEDPRKKGQNAEECIFVYNRKEKVLT